MAWVSREHQERVESHGILLENNDRICPINNAVIRGVMITRSVHTELFPRSGPGQVREVLHPFCPTCDEEPQFRSGEPIQESDLVNVPGAILIKDGV